jgi:lipoyl(octanoyl) transferase
MVTAVREGRDGDALLLLEHPHVFTMGKAASAHHVLWDEDERARRAVEVIWSDRGGEATYHGPGQLVGYPILDLARLGLSIPGYIESLERSLIEYLRELGIESQPGETGLTGVWSGGKQSVGHNLDAPARKVAAIGIKLNRSVVSHGFALNLTTNLEYFEGIIPCGHADKEATSVHALNGRIVDTRAAATAYARHFARVFGVDLDWVTAERLHTVEQIG